MTGNLIIVYSVSIFALFLQIEGITHWVVTENGRIQSQLASPFAMRRPFDLPALLEQEARRDNINVIYQDLITRKDSIEKKWSSLEGITSKNSHSPRHYPECLFNGKELPDIDEVELYTHIALNGSEHKEIVFNLSSKGEVKSYKVPDCTKYYTLNFSTYAYEHFASMKQRNFINITAEKSLTKLMPVSSVKLFGHEIFLGLQKNHSSWLHYNLGALYWRIKGNGTKSIECSRRALHFVPTYYRDIPIHNLAGILHSSKLYSEEAASLLHAAIEHSPKEPAHYLALGQVYFSVRDFNRSSQAFSAYLKLKPDKRDLYLIKFVTCQWKIEQGLLNLQESLEGVLSELHEYHSQQQQLIRLQERLVWEQSSFSYDMLDLNSEQTSSWLSKKSHRCVQKVSENSKATIMCNFIDDHLPDLNSLNLHNLFHHVETETQKITEQLASSSYDTSKLDSEFEKTGKSLFDNFPINTKFSEDPAISQKYPTSMLLSNNLYFDTPGWPTKEQCVRWNLPLDEDEDLYLPVFLPPENKGYRIKEILSDMIDLPEGSEHPLPWYPPVCENVFGDKYIPPFNKQILNKHLKSNKYLQEQLLKYVNNGKSQEAEIGQRIITAIEKEAAPSWVLSTLASLYWRVRGNTKKALNCLDLAFQKLRKEPSDIVLVSIGSVIHQLGYHEHAMKFANVALKINHAEPATNFLLALLYYTSYNPVVAMYYMKNVLRVEPKYYDGKAEHLLKIWACRIKLGALENRQIKIEKNKDEVCSNSDEFESEGVVCNANGDQCKTANIHCYRTSKSGSKAEKTPTRESLENCNGENKYSSTMNMMKESEPDESNLESFINPEMFDSNNQHKNPPVYMKISMNVDSADGGVSSMGDFYVSVPSNDVDDFSPNAVVQVYDKSGNYPLSLQTCREIKEADWIQFTSMWSSVAARNVDIAQFLKPLTKSLMDKARPYCLKEITSSKLTLDHLTLSLLNNDLSEQPESSLSEWLGLMAGDQHASVKELGAKIALALQESSTSWILATSASIYWRVLGVPGEAIVCLRQALAYVPNDMRDIPLVNLANVLERSGLLKEALEVAYLAVKSHPSQVVNHFTVGNMHKALGEFDKAIHFYRSALNLDPNFDPARNRLQAILCTLLFDEEFHKHHMKLSTFSQG